MPAHKSVLRETLKDVLSNYTVTDDPELEEELVESLSVVFDIEDDESEGLDVEA